MKAATASLSALEPATLEVAALGPARRSLWIRTSVAPAWLYRQARPAQQVDRVNGSFSRADERTKALFIPFSQTRLGYVNEWSEQR